MWGGRRFSPHSSPHSPPHTHIHSPHTHRERPLEVHAIYFLKNNPVSTCLFFLGSRKLVPWQGPRVFARVLVGLASSEDLMFRGCFDAVAC